MKTIERYVFGSFLSSFALAFLVLSFVMTIGLLVQIVGYVLDGVAPSLIWDFALVSFPETLQWTVPLAILVSSVLVFSRLSSDSEIAAMRSCGVNIALVMRWPVVFGLACSLLAAWVNNEIVPRGHEVRRSLKSRVSVDTGLNVLEPGRWIDDFPKVRIYFGSKEGSWIYDLIVMDYSNPKVDRTIRASKALVTGEGRDVSLDLYGMTVDPLDENHPGMMRVSRYRYVMKDALKNPKYNKKAKDLRFSELRSEIRESRRREKDSLAKLYAMRAAEEGDGYGYDAFSAEKETKALVKNNRRERSKMKVELAKRFVFAAASLCFVLVGIPLGIRAQRRESSIGMAISLAIALGYYLVVILMLSLEKNYATRPDLLIWLPVFVSFALAARFTSKNL